LWGDVLAMKHWQIGLLGAVVSLLAVYFVASQMNIAEMTAAFSSARYEFLLLCALLLTLGLSTRAVRWQRLLGSRLTIWRAFHILNISYLVNGLLPLRIGEVGRIFLATRIEPPVPPLLTTSTILVERLLDLLAVVLLIALALLGGSVPNELRAAALLFGSAALIGFFVLALLAQRRDWTQAFVIRLAQRFPPLARWQVGAWVGHFLDGLAPLTRPASLLTALLWTGVSWGLSVAAGYVLMYAFFPSASWAATALFIAAAALAIAVPAVPGNIGTYEASIVFALSAMNYGEPYGTAVAFAVVVHGVNLILYAILGVIGFVEEGISLAQLSQGVEKMTNPG
jgi:hypothetical protein